MGEKRPAIDRKWIIMIGGLVILVMAAVFIPMKAREDTRTLDFYNLVIWSPELVDKFEEIAYQWGKMAGVDVHVTRVTLDELDAKLAAFVQTGIGADMAVVQAHKIPMYRDELLDLTELAEEIGSEFGGYYDIAREMTTVKGRFFGVPLYAWSHIWVYNGKFLQAKGLKPADTYAEAEELALRLSEGQSDFYPYGIGLGKDDDAAMFLQALLWAFGGRIVEEDGRTVAINSAETRAAMSYVIRLYREDKVISPGALGWDGASNNKNFLGKRIAFTMNAPTILIAAKRDDPELAKNIIHTIYPKGPNGRFSYATGFALAALRSTKKRTLIESFLRYFYTRENYRALISAGGGAVNPWLEGCQDLPIWEDPQLSPGIESLAIEKHVGWPGPVTEAAAEVFDRRILADIIHDVINNGMSLDEAIVKAEIEIKFIYEEHGSRSLGD